MTEPTATEALTSFFVALLASPIILLTGTKGISGLRWLAQKFLDLTKPA